MAMKAGELRAALSGLQDDATVYVALNGAIVPVGVTKAEKVALAILKAKGKPREGKHFTTAEDGLIGGLQAMGASDAMIADVLDRPE